MLKKQQVVGVLSIFLIAVFYFVPGLQAEKNVSGKTFYTIANIRYEKPERIYSTNYHKGAIIPVGTKVTIKNVSDRDISFVNDRGVDFIILYIKKHHPGISIWDHFDRYFSEMNPLVSGGSFDKFTKSEQDSIKAGEIKVGMSKGAVLMSYGYPPPIKTSTLNSDRWVYMENRFVTRAVQFKDGKVTKVR